MPNIVTIDGVESTLITYKDRPVCTTLQLAQFYGCSEKNLSDNFAYQRERFEEGKHFVKLEGAALRAFREHPENSGSQISPMVRSLLLWTEMGAARHAKMLTTDKAWEVFEEMEGAYFRAETGTCTAKSVTTPLKATAEAAKAFAPLVRVARLLGCDKNAAAISANQAIYSMTNINLMQQLGHTHIEAEKQDHWYTPTELGKQMTPAVSARQVNLLLAEAGLQFKRGDVWEASDAGKDFARIYDTGKRHGSGVPVTQMKWSHTAVAVLQALPAENKEAA